MNLFESLQQLSESENIVKEADCCKGTFHFVNSDGNSLSMDEPELDEYKKFDGAEVKITGNHVMNDETGEGYVDIEFPNGETLDYVSSSHIKFDIEESAVLKDEKDMEQIVETKEIKTEAMFPIKSYNMIKEVLNKNNPIKNILRLTLDAPGNVNENNYIIRLQVRVANYADELSAYHNGNRAGLGRYLYVITINMIDETVSFKDDINEYELKAMCERAAKTSSYSADELYTTIVNVAETSKKDVEKLILSKNFIYNLSGQKGGSSYSNDYTIHLKDDDVSDTQTEDFSESMPKWLKMAIKQYNTSRGTKGYRTGMNDLPLDTAEFEKGVFPKSGKLPDDKINFLLIDGSGEEKRGDYFVYAPSLGIGVNDKILVNGRNRDISSMSIRALEPYVVDYVTLPREILDVNKEKHKDRVDAQSGTVDRVSADDVWRYGRNSNNIDKSGYIVDPEKYKRKLAALHADDYSNRLEDLYVVLTGVRAEFKKYLKSDDFLPQIKKGTDGKYVSMFGDNHAKFERLYKSYTSAVGYYREATDCLDKIEAQTDTWGKTAYEQFDKNIKSAESKIAEVLSALKS